MYLLRTYYLHIYHTQLRKKIIALTFLHLYMTYMLGTVDNVICSGTADPSSNVINYNFFSRVFNVWYYCNNFLSVIIIICLRSKLLFKKNSEFLAFTCKIYGIYVICIKKNNFIMNYVNGVYFTCECPKFTVFFK